MSHDLGELTGWFVLAAADGVGDARPDLAESERDLAALMTTWGARLVIAHGEDGQPIAIGARATSRGSEYMARRLGPKVGG